MKYVLIYIPDQSLKIYGPFATNEAAIAWGQAWDDENKLPFWQVINNPDVDYFPAPV